MMVKFATNTFARILLDGILESLSSSPGLACLVAGGTDLLLDIEQGRHPPVHRLIDVSRRARHEHDRRRPRHGPLGGRHAPTPTGSHPLIREHALALAEAGELIGGPQVRPVATLGGNVAHALPAGDGTIALLALDAEAQLAGPDGVHWVPLESLFMGPGEPSFRPRPRSPLSPSGCPKQAGEGSAFHRIMRPQGVAIAILNMGCWVRLARDGTIEDIRLAIGPAGPRPLRAAKG